VMVDLIFVFMGCVWLLRICKENRRNFFNSPFHFIIFFLMWILLFFKIVDMAFFFFFLSN